MTDINTKRTSAIPENATVQMHTCNTLGRTKRKGAFEHAQNAQLRIYTSHAQSSIRSFAITKTRLFKFIENFTSKAKNFLIKNIIFFIFLFKTEIVGTRENRLGEAVLTSTHDLFLGRNNKKNNVYHCKSQFYCIKVGSKLYRYVFVMLSIDTFYSVK